MKSSRRAPSKLLTLALAISPFALACGADPSSTNERLGQSSAAVTVNGSFETGTAGMVPPSPWAQTLFVNLAGLTLQTPQTFAGLNLTAHGGACTMVANCTGVNPQQGTTCAGGFCQPVSHTLLLNSAAGPGTQTDPTLGAAATLRWPRYGNQCALVNQLGNHANVNQLTQTMTLGAADVDPNDSRIHVRLVVAPVLEDPGHPDVQQPYYFVQLTNVTQGAVVYSELFTANQQGTPWRTVTTGGAAGSTYRYTDWQLVDIAQSGSNLATGDQVELLVLAAGCSLGAHMGELYVDGVGVTPPGLFVTGTGPAQVNAGASVTYSLVAQNGSPRVACSPTSPCAAGAACVSGACAETGVTVRFQTPPGTSFRSATPPAGATCTMPAVGTSGVLTCTFTNPMPSGATVAFSVTVDVPPGSMARTLIASDYGISSTQETMLLGNRIRTQLGCTLDSQCPSASWCTVSSQSCVPRLANGAALPTDPPHTSPTLNGVCSAMAGALVCASGVCDADNRCGYASGGGSCTAATAATVCRSGACATSGARAGTCVACVDDSTCSGGTPACDAATNTCVACTATSAALCTGNTPVCDATTRACAACGGDFGSTAPRACPSATAPFCTATGACGRCADNAACRMGTHAGPICNAAMGNCGTACAADSDCASMEWCNDVASSGPRACAPRLPNGQALPGGACTAMLGARACTSGLCADAGPNAGRCVECSTSAQCSGATPLCDPATNACVAPPPDAGAPDASTPEASVADASAAEASVADVGVADALSAEASAADARVADAGGSGRTGNACACRAGGPRGGSSGRGLAAASLAVALALRPRRRSRAGARREG